MRKRQSYKALVQAKYPAAECVDCRRVLGDDPVWVVGIWQPAPIKLPLCGGEVLKVLAPDASGSGSPIGAWKAAWEAIEGEGK